VQTSPTKPVAAQNLIACERCGAEFPPQPGAATRHCPQCGAAHDVAVIATPHYHCLLFSLIEDGADAAEVQRSLHAQELEIRPLMLELEQQRLLMNQLVSEAERTALMLRQSFQFPSGSMLPVVGWALLLIVLAQIGGGLSACLLLPVVVWAMYQLVQACRRARAEQRERLAAARSLLAAKEREIDLYARHVAALEERLLAYARET